MMACALGLAAATGAWAGPAVPPPAAAVTTYLSGGATLPVSGVSADWSGVKPGCSGTLRASGVIVSGTTTVVTGQFTSQAFRPRHGRLLQVRLNQDGREVVQPLPEGYVASFRFRVLGHRWTSWFTFGVTSEPSKPPASLLYSYSTGGGIGITEALPRSGHQLPVQQVQTRFRDVITATGMADDEWKLRLGC
jgi:hypothetical protein